MTIKTIANNINLSLTTVSRVLNGSAEKYRISSKTSKLVLEEANRIGYIPNMAAKTLRLNKSRTIGLLLPSLSNPFFSLVASTVNQLFYARGYVVLMSDCNNDKEEEKKLLRSMLSQNLMGLLVIPTGDKKNFVDLTSSRLPSIFIDRYFKDVAFHHVSTDHYGSVQQLMSLLYDKGHRKIACIQGDRNVMSNILRIEGYKDFVKSKMLDFSYIGGSSFTSEEGYIETKILLQMQDEPTAIVAFSDTILLGVLKALKEEKKVVPQDISVVSIDNSEYLDYLEVPITSISQPVRQISNLAAKLLLGLIEAPNEEKVKDTHSILLESNIIHRSSVKQI